MISKQSLDALKTFTEFEANLIPGGVVYGIIEGDTMTWVKYSDNLDLNVFYVGLKLDHNSTTMTAIREKRAMSQNVPRSAYGTRLTISSIPIIDEQGNSIGAFSMAIPKLHPVVKAFPDFAPMLSEMFSEGVQLRLTDLNKIVLTQSSQKFDIPSLKEGVSLNENSIESKAIKSKKPQAEEVDTLEYGVPVRLSAYPLFDEGTNEVVAAFSVTTPKEIAVTLRNMSSNLENNLTGISSTIQELAASASQIHANQQNLNTTINEITALSEKINEVSHFIKEIADETKMLGLNASIEAARAGEFGRGFGVVANEIRRLSDQSKTTIPKIAKLTEDIIAKVDESNKKSENSLSASQEQAAATEEITAGIEEITSTCEELNKIAHSL
ncbi:chemotaxis protein [Clostridium carboxidivorans P7]|uniref:methyl-accepting chemotaxis protein n=1 Tax=Clostridium carboxidivorans TaxID=217159 RepID=UPI0001D38FE0|nr:methyl-accepting chemotaxis protein [Clostridium carboxidivorans]AKN29596.1 chemotaxis protein [Clostridium carboxidivorans P7]EFG89479.1 methyl-accepting chemotaxis protein signaling domain protein [Clostridium carboxidivorans P7]